jgi:hypothetical protein
VECVDFSGIALPIFPASQPPLLLLLGQPPERWPDPLPGHLAAGRFALTAFATIYALAAAAVVERCAVAVVVNVGSISRPTALALQHFQEALRLPVIVLPGVRAPAFATPWDAVSWEDLMDGGGSAPASRQMAVTGDIHARYDEPGMQPILSDLEIRALLGAPDGGALHRERP